MIFFKILSSVVHSWMYCREGFAPVYEYLTKHKEELQYEVIWTTRHKCVRKVKLPAEVFPDSIAYKTNQNPRHVRFFLQPSLAYREARGFFIVRHLGIPSVEALALGETRCFGNLQSSFFISRFAEGFHPGAELVHEQMTREDEQIMDEFIRRNLAWLARLHRAGYSHGGTHFNNFLWKKNDAGVLEILWLDLATVRRLPILGKKNRRTSDLRMFLNCFSLSLEEEQTYLKFYEQEFCKTAFTSLS